MTILRYCVAIQVSQTQNASGPVIFEAASQHAHTAGPQRGADGVARKPRVVAAFKAKTNGPVLGESILRAGAAGGQSLFLISV